MTNGTASETNGIASETNGDGLRSCPFCGGEALIDRVDEGADYRPWYWWTVHCANRECVCADLCHEYDTKAEAIAAWNTRAAVTGYDFAMAVHDGNLWGKCSECKERQGYYLDAETIRNQQERIAELEAVVRAHEHGMREAWAEYEKRDELIRDLWAGIVREHPQGGFPDMGLMEQRMRELGIEVV